MDQFLDPVVLNNLINDVYRAVRITKISAPNMKAWLGETSSAWNSGAPGISDRYIAGFM